MLNTCKLLIGEMMMIGQGLDNAWTIVDSVEHLPKIAVQGCPLTVQGVSKGLKAG